MPARQLLREPRLGLSRRLFVSALISAPFAGRALAAGTPNENDRVWNSFKTDVFGDKPVVEDSGVIAIEAPKRAQDAALVPVEIRIDPLGAPDGLKSLTLIVDVNPSPVAATITFGPQSGVRAISTRVRVDDYSYVRAIGETPDGALHLVKTFVKASGGCSAPALKNQDEALQSLGLIKVRQFPPKDGDATAGVAEMQVQIRHPNNSGFQRDPLTHHFIPAHFVNSIAVSVDGRRILAMDGGISISEDPNFRFDYRLAGGKQIEVEAADTEGKSFTGRWPVETAAL